MANRANSQNTGTAAEYFVLSQLYRQGFEAYITLGNTKAIDIRFIRPNGTAATIDVKAVRGYSSLIVNNVVPRSDHFIIFVTYNNKFDDVQHLPKVFVVPSVELPTITKLFGKEKRVLKGQLEQYRDNWATLAT